LFSEDRRNESGIFVVTTRTTCPILYLMRFSSLALRSLALLALLGSFPGPGNPGKFAESGIDKDRFPCNSDTVIASRSSPSDLASLAFFTSRCDTGILLARATEDATATTVDAPPQGAEKFAFEAEVHKMLDIVINSLYQNKDIFLRELISNASDALDKFRYLELTHPETYKTVSSTDLPLTVKVMFDPDQQTLTIRDTGIGMTHDDLVSNLGTVARSGTTKFIESLTESGKKDEAMAQIGKFGVGFYSSFLVAQRVRVASIHPTQQVQHVWESLNGSSDFLVYPDPRGNTLQRGTEITLYLKEEALEYADQARLRELAQHYSEFVDYPISLRSMTTMTVDAEEDEEEKAQSTAEKKKDADDLEVKDEDGAEAEDPPKKKTKDIKVESWDLLNGNKAIWTRKDDISEEEYQAFYKAITGDESITAAAHSHFEAEGNINFKSLLYLPEELPSHYSLGNIDTVEGGMKLYVRRVLISDSFDFLPKYLGFVRGVVDSDDLQLNVNRESLQESKILKIIKKKVVRKSIEMIKSFADKYDSQDAKEVELDEQGNVVESSSQEDSESRYIKWYKKFAPNLKLGVMDDEANRSKLTKLLRFQTSKSDGKMISLDSYLKNMKEWQNEIYVLGGISVKELESSPFLEIAREKDVEVLYLTDAVDEYMVKQVLDYNKKKFVQLSSENVKFKDEDVDLIRRREKVYKKKFAPLVKWLRNLYHGTVLRVQVAKRGLGSVPAIVASSDFGNSANMERIIKAQAFQHGVDPTAYMALKVFEFNPRHPLILKLLDACPPEDAEEDFKVSQEIEDAAWMIHDMAMLNGGFSISDTKGHNRRLLKVLKANFALESLALEPEIDPPVEEDEPPEPNFSGLNAEDFMDGKFNMDDFADLDLGGMDLGNLGSEDIVDI
jgi:heat shock protein 90kDa beta